MELSRRLVAFFALVLLTSIGLSAAHAEPIRVFAAASLKNALDDAAKSWKGRSGKDAILTYAASSALAKQVEQGAPADIFISADLDWMDYLDKKGAIDSGSRKNLLGNQLVLVAAKGSGIKLDLARGA